MKKLGIVFVLFLTYSIGFSQSHTNTIWEENYQEAKAKAAKEHKKLLVFFTGSDWCGPCKKLTAHFFESAEFQEIATESLVLYEANFPRNKSLVTSQQAIANAKLGREYKINSFPTIMIFNEKGKKIGQRKGYNMSDPSYHFKFLKNTIKK